MKKTRAALGLASAVLVLTWAVPARASMQTQKDAKAAGIAGVENCQSCHVDKLPKKGASALSARGQFLVDKKAAKKTDKIDVAWLKEYVEKK